MSALANGFHPVAPGRVAVIVTYLEMRGKAPTRRATLPEGFSFRQLHVPEPAHYRDLFSRVGGHDWLWTSRLLLDDGALAQILHDPGVEVYVIEQHGRAEGLLELDFREAGACELAFFGLTDGLIGQGLGRWLMDRAIERAWAEPIARFHVHTCTADHPGALAFYQRSGFVPRRQEVEIFDDPRLGGPLPRGAAPHIPIFDAR